MFNKLLQCACGEKWADVAPLVLRVALGIVFAAHGYDKVFIKGISGVAGFLASLGFPASTVFAYILAYGELAAGALLVLGLFTHWAAKFAAIVGVVAFFTVHLKNGFSVGSGGYEYIMLIFAAAASVMISGAGKYSLDAMWWKKGSN